MLQVFVCQNTCNMVDSKINFKKLNVHRIYCTKISLSCPARVHVIARLPFNYINALHSVVVVILELGKDTILCNPYGSTAQRTGKEGG